MPAGPARAAACDAAFACMPIVINGEIVPAELIREQERSLPQLPEWQGVPDGLEKGMRLRQAAESSMPNLFFLAHSEVPAGVKVISLGVIQ